MPCRHKIRLIHKIQNQPTTSALAIEGYIYGAKVKSFFGHPKMNNSQGSNPLHSTHPNLRPMISSSIPRNQPRKARYPEAIPG